MYAPSVQRVDLYVDGKLRNVRQLSTNPALTARVVSAMQSARTVELRRSEAPASPPPPPPARKRRLRNVVFFAQVTEDSIAGMLSLPREWTAAVTADLAYQTPELVQLIAACKAHGYPIRPWCDCGIAGGNPPGTPYSAAVQMQAHYELGQPIGQAENSGELRRAIGAGALDVIGNPNEWTAAERESVGEMIAAGTFAVSGEMYRVDPGYSAQGVDIASVTWGIGLDADSYTPALDYAHASSPEQVSTACVYHGAALRRADWQLLASIPL